MFHQDFQTYKILCECLWVQSYFLWCCRTCCLLDPPLMSSWDEPSLMERGHKYKTPRPCASLTIGANLWRKIVACGTREDGMSAAAYRRTTVVVWRCRMLLECAASNISLYLSLYLSCPGNTSYNSHIIWSFNLLLMDLFNHLLQFAKRLTACFQLTLYVKT